MISIDPATFIITIPKADLTLIQATPTEIRELDINAFRLELKAYEDDEIGMYLPKTHNHNTEVTLGGLTFARVVDILAPYTVTFEDGQYAVNLTGANSNIGDRVNVNQVSVRSANSAGLISSPDIEYSSFQGKVWIDPDATTTGTTFPRGTPKMPVNNLIDALLIADSRGFEALHILGDISLDSGTNIDNFILTAKSTDVMITLEDDLSCVGISIYNAHIVGILDGNTHLQDCIVGDVIYFSGHMHHCGMYGTVYLDGNDKAVIHGCYTTDQDYPPTINMGGTGQSLSMPNFSGLITISNLTSATEEVGIGLDSGVVTLASSVTAGTIIISGIGGLVDNSTGGSVDSDGLVSRSTIADSVWDETAVDHIDTGTSGKLARDTKLNVDGLY